MRNALLVMDIQSGIVERLPELFSPLVDTIARIAAAARAADVPVIYVRVAFRSGAPEVSDHNRAFAALATSGAWDEQEPATQIHSGVAPESGDVVVTKRRVSAFTGGDLDVVLRAMGVDTLVLTGISTSGVVLSTVRQAADLEFRLIVLRDACADSDDEVHRVLMDKVFPRQAEVVTSDEWVATL